MSFLIDKKMESLSIHWMKSVSSVETSKGKDEFFQSERNDEFFRCMSDELSDFHRCVSSEKGRVSPMSVG